MRKWYTYKVNVVPAEEGGFVATIPALPSCQTQGDTYDEALENAREAILGYIESLLKHGEPVPVEVRHPAELVLMVKASTAV